MGERLLFLSKRRPQQRDLVERPYGRFFHLPAALAALGFDVRVALIGHAGDASRVHRAAGIDWHCLDLRSLGPWKLERALDGIAAGQSPDWIIGCSDAWIGVVAARLARRTGSRLALDAYDNYESYMPWNLPLHWAWRRALRRADLVTAAGPGLAALLDRSRPGRPATRVVPMAADPVFRPMARSAARASLGLPVDRPVYGYYGGWGPERGTDMLFEVVRRVRASRPDALFVASGRPPAALAGADGVRTLGYIADELLPAMVSSLDASCIVTAETAFGSYSYPAKLCEAMACGTPVVATTTSPVRWMLEGRPGWQVPPGDVGAFAGAVLEALDAGRMDYGPLPSWEQCAGQLAALFSNNGNSQPPARR